MSTSFPHSISQGGSMDGGGEGSTNSISLLCRRFLPSFPHISSPSAISPPPLLSPMAAAAAAAEAKGTNGALVFALSHPGGGDDNVDNPCVTLIFDMLSISAHAGDRRRRRFSPSSFLPCLRAVPFPCQERGGGGGISGVSFATNTISFKARKMQEGREGGGEGGRMNTQKLPYCMPRYTAVRTTYRHPMNRRLEREDAPPPCVLLY